MFNTEAKKRGTGAQLRKTTGSKRGVTEKTQILILNQEQTITKLIRKEGKTIRGK